MILNLEFKQSEKFESKVKTFSDMKQLRNSVYKHGHIVWGKKELFKAVFWHNAKWIEERGSNGIQESLAAEWDLEDGGRSHSESKRAWIICFQSFSNIGLCFIYYEGIYTILSLLGHTIDTVIML